MSRRAIKVLALASFLVLTNGGIALGKGPESVTITGPGVGSPIELINPDFFHGDYTDQVKVLMRQTSLWYATGGGSRLSAKPEGELGPAYTLTWINSGPPDDPVEERTIIQLLYLQAEKGPVVHTPPQEGLMDWGPGVVGWFLAPDDLADTLASLGGPLSDAGAAGPVAIGAPERLGLFGAIASAILLLLWVTRRRLGTTERERV